jgi:hypothetical protein
MPSASEVCNHCNQCRSDARRASSKARRSAPEKEQELIKDMRHEIFFHVAAKCIIRIRIDRVWHCVLGCAQPRPSACGVRGAGSGRLLASGLWPKAAVLLSLFLSLAFRAPQNLLPVISIYLHECCKFTQRYPDYFQWTEEVRKFTLHSKAELYVLGCAVYKFRAWIQHQQCVCRPWGDSCHSRL